MNFDFPVIASPTIDGCCMLCTYSNRKGLNLKKNLIYLGIVFFKWICRLLSKNFKDVVLHIFFNTSNVGIVRVCP